MIKQSHLIFGSILLALIVACNGATSTPPGVTETATAVASSMPTKLPTVTSTPIRFKSATPTPTSTMNSTQQTWRSTAVAVATAEWAAILQAWDDRATAIAQFPDTCEGHGLNAKVNSSAISPDGNWIASNCYENQTLIVQNKEGMRWVLRFKDFLSLNMPEGTPGILQIKFWSPDGQYIYTSHLKLGILEVAINVSQALEIMDFFGSS